jgi:hypothetical protein
VTVKHIVIWTIDGDEQAKAAASASISELLTSLVGKIDSIRSLTVGTNGIWPEKNADIAIVADFDDYAGLEIYQDHPEHLAVAAEIRALVSGRTSIDYEY